MKEMIDKWNIPTIDTFREKSFALSDALYSVMEAISPTPLEDCGYDNCKDCPNYHRILVRYRNYMTESNSIEPVKEPYYDEEDYGGYCEYKIKNF